MKYKIILTVGFKKKLKILKKRNKNFEKMTIVVNSLARGDNLDEKFRDHQLVNSKKYYNCRECHIEPDWLLVYQINNNDLILLLLDTGSHSDLFVIV